MHKVPENLKYLPSHTWAKDLGDNHYRVGITDFAQDELGDVVYVDAPQINSECVQGNACSVVESVKSTSDIYCPLNGVIVEFNSALEDSPELINSDPYGEGWIFTLKAKEDSGVTELIDATAYSQFTEEG